MPPNVSSPILAAAAVGLGGFVGALARWGVGLAAAGTLGTRVPWGTLLVNLAGCLLIGALKPLADRMLTPWFTLAAITGFLGAFTTFSTFSLDTLALARATGPRAATLYVAVSVLGGLALCALGARLAARLA